MGKSVPGKQAVPDNERYKTSVGYQRNNPGNLMVRTIQYKGRAVNQPKGGPVLFVDEASGMRALAVDIKMKLKPTPAPSVTQFISQYAPSYENDTATYIKTVAAKLNITPTMPIPKDDDTRLVLMDIIIRIEVGFGENPYTEAVIKQGIEDAKTSWTEPLKAAPEGKTASP